MLYLYERKITELLDYNEFPQKKERKYGVGERMLNDMSIRHKVKNFILFKKEKMK